jgi:hypothetical protein
VKFQYIWVRWWWGWGWEVRVRSEGEGEKWGWGWEVRVRVRSEGEGEDKRWEMRVRVRIRLKVKMSRIMEFVSALSCSAVSLFFIIIENSTFVVVDICICRHSACRHFFFNILTVDVFLLTFEHLIVIHMQLGDSIILSEYHISMEFIDEKRRRPTKLMMLWTWYIRSCVNYYIWIN